MSSHAHLVKNWLVFAAAACACSGNADGVGDASIGGADAGNGLATGGKSNSGGTFSFGGTSTTHVATGGHIATGGTNSGLGGIANTGGVASTAACPLSPPNSGAPCGGTTITCFYDECPANGRQLATCTNGVWTVQTSSTCTVNCPFMSTSCPSGDVCVVRSGGGIMATCVKTSCNQALVTAQCAGAAGCTLSASLTNGATFTCPTSCPPGSGGCA